MKTRTQASLKKSKLSLPKHETLMTISLPKCWTTRGAASEIDDVDYVIRCHYLVFYDDLRNTYNLTGFIERCAFHQKPTTCFHKSSQSMKHSYFVTENFNIKLLTWSINSHMCSQLREFALFNTPISIFNKDLLYFSAFRAYSLQKHCFVSLDMTINKQKFPDNFR